MKIICLVLWLSSQAIMVLAPTHLPTPSCENGYCIPSLNFENRFPYLTSIRQPGSRAHVCSGILISSNLVVTAAHCIDETSAYSAGRKPILHIGPMHVNDINENVEVVLVHNSSIHPDWDKSQRSGHNLALLQLETASKKPYPRLLFDHFKLRTGQKLTAIGLGTGGEEISVGSDVFGPVKIEAQELIQQEDCNRPTLWNGSVPEGVICAINDAQKSSCLVDSGAPLLLLDQPKYDLSKGQPNLDLLVGFNIDGAPCGTPNKADLFISLEYVHNWIASH